MLGQSQFPLPPITPAYLQYSTFEWCQIRFVFTRELTRRTEPLGWRDAYAEAGLVVEAIRQSEVPLAYGARPNEVVWSTLICAANTYAHMSESERARMRAELAAGRPIWTVAVVIEEPHLCDRKVLEDPEYLPEPSCVPSEPRLGVLGFLAGALAFTGLAAASRLLSRKPSARPIARRPR